MPTDERHDARVVIEVVAGLLPGRDPDPRYTKRWAITSAEWDAAFKAGDRNQMDLLAERNGQAQGYAGLLMLQPDIVNWVRTEWIWT